MGKERERGGEARREKRGKVSRDKSSLGSGQRVVPGIGRGERDEGQDS